MARRPSRAAGRPRAVLGAQLTPRLAGPRTPTRLSEGGPRVRDITTPLRGLASVPPTKEIKESQFPVVIMTITSLECKSLETGDCCFSVFTHNASGARPKIHRCLMSNKIPE